MGKKEEEKKKERRRKEKEKKKWQDAEVPGYLNFQYSRV